MKRWRRRRPACRRRRLARRIRGGLRSVHCRRALSLLLPTLSRTARDPAHLYPDHDRHASIPLPRFGRSTLCPRLRALLLIRAEAATRTVRPRSSRLSRSLIKYLPLERAELDTGTQDSLTRKLTLLILSILSTYMTVPVSITLSRAQPLFYLRRTRSRVQNVKPSKLSPFPYRFRLSTLRPRRCT